MADEGSGRRRRGWLAPRGGGYTFRARSGRGGRRAGATPPAGSAGVGNFERDGQASRPTDGD